MNYIKKELNKLMPFALLYGALGGVMLILVNNLLSSSVLAVAFAYSITIGVSVYLLNNMRFRRDTKSSVLYGLLVFAVMTAISYVDTIMNTTANFENPMFDHLWLLGLMLIGVLFLSGAIAFLSKRAV